jgi:NAD+ kinase
LWVENFLIRSGGLATENEDEANAYLVAGGDGSFMRAIREKYEQGKVFLGINRGTLGFLLNPINCINDIPTTLDQITVITVRLMKVIFIDGSGNQHEFLAFNDAFCGGDIADFIKFKITGKLDHFPNREVSGNGIVISTPQGTTGYALKARGTSAVLPLDTNNWFVSGVATGPYPCDQVTPQEICVEVSSRKPVNGYADGHDQKVEDVAEMRIIPTSQEIAIGFMSNVDFAARRTSLAQLVERGG